jgi:hypothetical protein
VFVKVPMQMAFSEDLTCSLCHSANLKSLRGAYLPADNETVNKQEPFSH